ncbi:MAG: hypothetical protein CSA20_00400 [Deltaproteobacteria bacterium]|nr:MAG: hypothetical protein CSA20_00400 [Deltaproteobacteria bacterium]
MTYSVFVRISRALLLPILVLMLYAGLQQKGYDYNNGLRWDPQSGGYVFTRNSIAYTKERTFFFEERGDLTIELLVKPLFQTYPSFQFLLLLYGEGSDDQLLIGQWNRSLVVMNGADYSNKKREPKLYVPLGEGEGPRKVRVVSDSSGVSVYLDDRLAMESRQARLHLPKGRDGCRIVLGNSISGRNPWYGVLYRLGFFGEDGRELRYNFSALAEGGIQEQFGRGPEILLPARIPVLDKRILLWPKDVGMVRHGLMLLDIAVNFIGFVPLGILLPIVVDGICSGKKISPFLVSFFLVLGFSLFIEVAQSFLSSRHSSLLDLLVNTGGGLVGILVVLFYKRQS